MGKAEERTPESAERTRDSFAEEMESELRLEGKIEGYSLKAPKNPRV